MKFYPVTGITQKGEGVIRMQGKVCFVPGALPGEEISICELKEKKKFSRARIQEIRNPDSFRIEPECPQYSRCGGCVWQHVQYEKQLVFKQEIIRQQMQRIAGLDIEIKPVIGMENPRHYRNKVAWHCIRNKETGALQLGFFHEESHQVVPLRGCFLPTEEMLAAGEELERGAEFYGLQEQDEIILRVSSQDDTFLLAVCRSFERRGKKQVEHAEALQNIGQLQAKVPRLESICIIENGKLRTTAGKGYQIQRLAGCTFQISAPSFFQTNFEQTEKLYQLVREAVGISKPKKILDAFCGAGTISCMLAKDGHEVTGIESNPSAVADAEKNNLRNQTNIEFICAPCEEGIARMKQRFDVVVLDPPRSGCMRGTLEAILQKQPEKIIYVSCEASTLARDVKILYEAGYHVQMVQPVDMFPYTAHVETVAVLSRINQNFS